MTNDRIGIAWSWDAALRGAICALPAVPVILAVNVSVGICFALGTVLVAFVGVPAQMSMRVRAYLIAVMFAVAYAVGCVIGQWPVVAVLALAALAYVSVLITGQNPRSQLIAMLVVPGFAVGMNEPVPDGFVIAVMFLAGGLWATFVSVMWHPAPGGPQAPARFSALGGPEHDERATRVYAICFALAVGIALAIGFAKDFQHVAWAAVAAAFVMRPDPGLLASRALGRALATLAGVCAAAVLFQRGLGEAALALVTVFTVSAMIATRTSPWYVTSAGTGLLVLLMSGISSTQQLQLSFHDRILETVIGAGLAMVFGVIVPRLLEPRGSRSGPATPRG
jgi:Fusaric acid resistance protein-like